MNNDKDIRLKMKELYEGTPHLWIDELAIPKKICLADVVIIDKENPGYMHGFEIKSEIDTLKRLELQIPYYSKVFSKCTLIVAEKHEEKAVEMIPDWWGIIVVVPLGFDEFGEILDDICLLEVREAKQNPVRLEAKSLLQLLWRTELLSLIADKKIDVDKKGRKQLLRTAILKSMNEVELEEYVIRFLLARENWKVPDAVNPYYQKRLEARKKRAEKRKWRPRRVKK